MFLAGIHLLGNKGCPISLSPNVFTGEAFGHDSSFYFVETETNFVCVPNTIGVACKMLILNFLKPYEM